MYSTEGDTALPKFLPPKSTVVQYQPVPMRVDNCRHTLKSIFSSNQSVPSLTNIIGTYMKIKVEKQLQRQNVVTGLNRISKPETRMYNHIMHKLETLSGKVLTDHRCLRSNWETAIAPYRRQAFAELYNANEIVRSFAKEFPQGPLILPKLDEYGLGIKIGPYYSAPSVLANRAAVLSLLAKVRTVILLDDSYSMTLPNRSLLNGGDGTRETRWSHARRLLSSIAPMVSQYNPHGIDLHFLNRTTFYTGLHTESEIVEAFDAGRPNNNTPTGQRVHDILDGYMSTLRYYSELMPLNLLVITDGGADDPVTLTSTIEEHLNKIITSGRRVHQLGIEFVQVGDSDAATNALLTLEEEVSQNHLRDIVGVTPATRISNLNLDLLLAIAVSGIDARLNGYMRTRGINL